MKDIIIRGGENINTIEIESLVSTKMCKTISVGGPSRLLFLTTDTVLLTPGMVPIPCTSCSSY
jgi:hypothetical protein